MLGKKSFGLLAIVFAKLAFDYTSIKVVDDFENPMIYKTLFMTMNLFGSIAKLAQHFGLSSEYFAFRYMVDSLGGVAKINKIDSHPEFQITDKLFNGIPVRIYSKKKSAEPSPVMVFYHGGGYMFGTVYTYDSYLAKLSTSLNATIVSVNYRFAPEFPYPIPTDDCWAATKYVLDHAKELNVNLDKLMLAGDSAGGNAALVTTQRLIRENLKKPKIQVLIYPWLQLASVKFPSGQRYRAGILSTFGFAKFAYWYMGVTNVTDEIVSAVKDNSVFALIKDPQVREKYKSYLDDRLIDSKYKAGLDYYDNYDATRQLAFPEPSSLKDSHIFVRDKELAQKAMMFFDINVSPSLADDSVLKQLPNTYMLVCELDGLKDENLVYSERLRRAGVKVQTAFYSKAFHAMVPMISPPFRFELADKMANDLIDYIKKNL